MLSSIFYVGMENCKYKICQLAKRPSYEIWGSFHDIGHSKQIDDKFPKVSICLLMSIKMECITLHDVSRRKYSTYVMTHIILEVENNAYIIWW